MSNKKVIAKTLAIISIIGVSCFLISVSSVRIFLTAILLSGAIVGMCLVIALLIKDKY